MKEEKEKISIEDDGVELIYDNVDSVKFEGEEYYKIDKLYDNPKGFMVPIYKRLDRFKNNIVELLSVSNSFIDVVKSSINKESYQAIISLKDNAKIKSGSLKIMTSEHGDLLANLVDTKTGKIVKNIKLEKNIFDSEFDKAFNNFFYQFQLAQITLDMKYIQQAIGYVIKGQENDRLALANSCKQRLFQTLEIENQKTKRLALINLIGSAEDARNQLMLSQTQKIEKIKSIPEDTLGMFIENLKQKGILNQNVRETIKELKDNVISTNMVSMVEALAYQELGEQKAANLSLQYYGQYINKTYLDDKVILKRLHSLDESPKNDWKTKLPELHNNIEKLQNNKYVKIKEELINE